MSLRSLPFNEAHRRLGATSLTKVFAVTVGVVLVGVVVLIGLILAVTSVG